MQRFPGDFVLGDFAALLVDHRAARLRPAKLGAGSFSGTRPAAGKNVVVGHGHPDGNAIARRKLRHAAAVYEAESLFDVSTKTSSRRTPVTHPPRSLGLRGCSTAF